MNRTAPVRRGSALAHIADQRLGDLPASIGPVQFGQLGRQVTVRCPRDLDPLMRRAGGEWDPGTRRWLIERRRIWPVIRALERATDPLFRQAGVDLDR